MHFMYILATPVVENPQNDGNYDDNNQNDDKDDGKHN